MIPSQRQNILMFHHKAQKSQGIRSFRHKIPQDHHPIRIRKPDLFQYLQKGNKISMNVTHQIQVPAHAAVSGPYT